MRGLLSLHGQRRILLIFMDGSAHLGLDKILGVKCVYAATRSAAVGIANPEPGNEEWETVATVRWTSPNLATFCFVEMHPAFHTKPPHQNLGW